MNTREELDKILTAYIKLFSKVKENNKVIDYVAAVTAMQKTILNDFNQEVECFNIKATEHYKSTKFALYDHQHQMTPHRCGFLWLRHNRIKKLIWREVEAEVEAEMQLRTLAVEQREEEIFPSEPEEPEKPSFLKRLFKRRRKEPEQSDFILIGATVPEPETPSKPSNAAHGASDAAHQSGDKAKENALKKLNEIIEQADNATPEETFNQPEPPEPVQTSEEPKKQRRRRNSAKTPDKPDDVSPVSEQLTGQIKIDEITN